MGVLHVSCLSILMLIKKCVFLVLPILSMTPLCRDAEDVQVINLSSMELHVQFAKIIHISTAQSMHAKIVQVEDTITILKNYVNVLKHPRIGMVPIVLNVHFLIILISQQRNVYHVHFLSNMIQKQKNV